MKLVMKIENSIEEDMVTRELDERVHLDEQGRVLEGKMEESMCVSVCVKDESLSGMCVIWWIG